MAEIDVPADPVAANTATRVAALYVETGGVYYGLPDVDPWDEERDARLYAGPWPHRTPIAFRDVLLDMARSASKVAA